MMMFMGATSFSSRHWLIVDNYRYVFSFSNDGHYEIWVCLNERQGRRTMNSIYDFEVKTGTGETTTLAPYKGNVMLIVNVASKCGFTPQYDGLEELYRKYSERGLVILGFPCNQFKNQEPGTDQEIQDFCRLNYGVSFPVLAKIEVNGDNAHPLYTYLKKKCPGVLGSESIKWNFTKFLVDSTGKVTGRFATTTKPSEIEDAIVKLLASV